MEFRETLLAAQRNQQQKSSRNYYKAGFDPPKKEQKQKDRLSDNIQKFLAKKEQEEKQKKLDALRKKEELLALRDPKALRKIQKTLKVIKSANKSVIYDAIDNDNTAVTREGPDQPDQDDYGYESHEAAALYEKWVQKYSKMPEEPKFSASTNTARKDLNGTRERVKNALQHEDEPVPHKRRRKGDGSCTDRDISPPSRYEPEKKKEEKVDKAKFKKPLPPPMDFNQLLKLAEQKKSVPVEVTQKKVVAETETERLMTKKQKREYEEEMARRMRRQERKDAEKSCKKVTVKEDKMQEKERKIEKAGFGRIPKLGDKSTRNDSPKVLDREKQPNDKHKQLTEKDRFDKSRIEKEKNDQEKQRLDRERLEKLKAERERIDRDIDRLNRDRDRLDKTKIKIESKSINKVDRLDDKSKLLSREQAVKKNIDLKSHNTYRIDRTTTEKGPISNKGSDSKYINGQSVTGKSGLKLPTRDSKEKMLLNKQKSLSDKGFPKVNGHNSIKHENDKRLPEGFKGVPSKRQDDGKATSRPTRPPTGDKQKMSNTFNFDKHLNSLGKDGQKSLSRRPDGLQQSLPGRRPRADDVKKKRRALDSESEYDSEMDDFIDDGDENMDYSRHIKEIFGYDRSKYSNMDDDDDPSMESSFARQQREEYISKKIGIMEDLEDMKMEAMMKKKSKGRRRISDDD